MDFCILLKNMGKNLSKNFSGKYSQKIFDHGKQYETDVLEKASKRAIPKAAEGTGYLINNKIADKITKTSITQQQNKSETDTNEDDKEISKERYISPEEEHTLMK